MTSEIQLNQQRQYWILALVVTLCFMGWHGYFYNIGDQEEHLPQVYKMFNQQLYPHDYYMVPVEATFSIRFYYKWTVFLCAQVLPVSAVCFLLTFICIYVCAWAVCLISQYFHKSFTTAFLAPFFLFMFFPDHALGDNSFQDNSLLCSTISVMFCTLALLQYFRKNWVLMAFFAGISGWFQIIESLIIISILSGLLIFLVKKPLKSMLLILTIYVVTASPMLLPMFSIHLLSHPTSDTAEYYKALYQIRNPNHYLPSLFPLIVYFQFGLFMFAGLVAASGLSKNARNFVYLISAIVISGMLLYYVLLEQMQVMLVGKTQWFKSSIWLTLIYSVCIAVACDKIVHRYLKHKFIVSSIKIAGLLVVVVAPFGIFNSKQIPIKRFNQNHVIGNYQKSDLSLMHEWIENNTPVDAVFLISPDDNSFLCEAKRSLLIGYKAVIHEPYFMIPWAENFQRIYNFRIDTLAKKSPYVAAINGFNSYCYEPLSTEQLDFRLDDLTKCKFQEQLGPVVHQQGNLVLTKVISNQN